MEKACRFFKWWTKTQQEDLYHMPTQRFTSSSYDQWVKIEKSYNAFCKAFDLLNPHQDEEETQYKILGSDFVADLLAFLDTLEP